MVKFSSIRIVAIVACCFILANGGANQDTCVNADGAEATCVAARTGDMMLQSMEVELSRMNAISSGRKAVNDMPKPSCLDESQQAEIPPESNQNANLNGTVYNCQYNVIWERSEYILQLMADNGADPEDYMFKVCWDEHADPNVRKFPWVQSSGGDFRYQLAAEGTVILNMMDQQNTWANGLQNVLPDALEYFARMGEVFNRKIIPKFMLFGWSKGATYLWPLCRWRQDLVQASLLLHGCNSGKPRWTKDLPKKSNADGVVPTLFISSKVDPFTGCTFKDTDKQRKNQKKKQDLTWYIESPCGHHPENCWPVCDYNDLYINPFWAFVKKAYETRQPCTELTKASKCAEQLCIWDEAEGFCEEVYPSRLSKFCQKFCPKTEVAACSGLEGSTCVSSYKVLPVAEAGANGMFSACEYVDGACTESSASYQCFFQDQC